MSDHNIFYVPPQSVSATEIIIREPQMHHIKHVLRKKTGDSIFLTDGHGLRYKAEIRDVGRSVMKAKILEMDRMLRKSTLEITVGFVPVKGLRNDLIIEKGTELGVSRFVAVVSEHSVLRNLSAQKIERFRKIATSAMVQSQQYHMPEIGFARSLEDLLASSSGYDFMFVADPQGEPSVPLGGSRVLLLVGPEGGFSRYEMDSLAKRGARLLGLGKTRLRSETAVIVGVSKILAAYGLI